MNSPNEPDDTMMLSEKNTTYSDLGNSGVESYAKLTVGGTDYSVQHIYEGRVGLFVLIDGKVYMGYARNNYLYYFTSDSGGYSVDIPYRPYHQ